MKAIISIDQKIINTLLLNASFIDNIGLMHGKMGICIYFFHLGRKTGIKMYEEYAGELIDEIYEEINTTTPLNFENGLAGIGWGVEYLVQNRFIEANTDEVLADFDTKLCNASLNIGIKNLSILTGAIGIVPYFLSRIKNPDSSDNKIPTLTIKHYLILLIDSIDLMLTDIPNFIKEPDKFDITWNYPMLLWLLAKIHILKIYKYKVEKIINKLVAPLQNKNNLPKLHSNRFLLAYTLSEIFNSYKTPITNEFSIKLFETIDIKVIYHEIQSDNSIRYGKAGMSQMIKKMPEYKEQWDKIICNSFKEYESFLNDAKINFGILEGITGTLLTSL